VVVPLNYFRYSDALFRQSSTASCVDAPVTSSMFTDGLSIVLSNNSIVKVLKDLKQVIAEMLNFFMLDSKHLLAKALHRVSYLASASKFIEHFNNLIEDLKLNLSFMELAQLVALDATCALLPFALLTLRGKCCTKFAFLV